MIVCSCNVLSDAQVKSAVASGAPRPRMSSIYASLGCAAKCGRGTRTIKTILENVGHCVAIDHRAIDAIPAR
jgi:bacterioferritin-associated ferredoxin